MPGDCCECGACCFSKSESYVPVTAEDSVRLGQAALSLTRELDGGRFMRMVDGHCGELQHLEGAWVCRIYKSRPTVCRGLERGSPACLAERALKRRDSIATSKRLLALAR